MVEVATGGETGEQLPMVLKVPHLSSTIEFARACGLPYSMLGFGDILVPGLLLSYCHSFDLLVGTPCKLYWLITNIGKIRELGWGIYLLSIKRLWYALVLKCVPYTLKHTPLASLQHLLAFTWWKLHNRLFSFWFRSP